MRQKAFVKFLMVLGAIAVVSIAIVLVGLVRLQERTTADIPLGKGNPVQFQRVNQNQIQPPAPQIDPAIPKEVAACLPEETEQALLIATKPRQGEWLYLLRVLSGDNTFEPLVSVKSGKCQVLNPRIKDSDVPLSSVVDAETAKAIAVMRFQKVIAEAGGKTKFEAGLADHAKASGGTVWMPREYYEALKQLAVKIPANVKPTDKVPNLQEGQ